MTPQEFDAFCTTHHRALVAHAERVFRLGRAEAEDIVQTVLERMLRRCSSIRESGALAYGQRAVKMQVRTLARDNAAHVRILEGADDSTPAHTDSTLSLACERALAEIRAPKLRTCAWLVYACGWELKDAAKSAGISPKAFKLAFRREYKSVREELARFVRHNKGGKP